MGYELQVEQPRGDYAESGFLPNCGSSCQERSSVCAAI